MSKCGKRNHFNINENLSGAKAPPCSSWDTGRVAPFVLVLLTDKISLVSIFYMSDAFIGGWLLLDGIFILFMSAAFIGHFLGK